MCLQTTQARCPEVKRFTCIIRHHSFGKANWAALLRPSQPLHGFTQAAMSNVPRTEWVRKGAEGEAGVRKKQESFHRVINRMESAVS